MTELVVAPKQTGMAAVPATPSPRLLDVLRESGTSQGITPTTVSTFADWVCRFARYHGWRHPPYRHESTAENAEIRGEEQRSHLMYIMNCRHS